MEIDPKSEKLYLLSQIAAMGILPGVTSYKTLHRYARNGILNLSGVTVFLQYIKTPAGFATSVEAVERFLEELNS